MRVKEVYETPRLVKMESAIQSSGQGYFPVRPIEDTVDLSGQALRIIKDQRVAEAVTDTPSTAKEKGPHG